MGTSAFNGALAEADYKSALGMAARVLLLLLPALSPPARDSWSTRQPRLFRARAMPPR